MSQPTVRRVTRQRQQSHTGLPAMLARRVVAASIIAAFGNAPGLVLAQLPTGADVVAGTAQITSGQGQMTIANSANAVLNWQSFSIGTDNKVHFEQPSASSKVLNRVVGNDPTSIMGSLSSNGEVWLVNPHGVLFGGEARIDVGGLVASTLGVTNNDFLNGRNRFGTADAPGAQVINHSKLTTSFGGRVWLVGGSVRNEGVIETPGGQVVLAAGQSIELVDSGMPNVTVRMSAPQNEVLNLGSLLAPSGGSIDVHGAIVNQSGIVRADSVDSGSAGRIILRAQGDVRLGYGSRISASATGSGVRGGSVLIESVTGTAEVEGDVLASSANSTGGQVQVLGRTVDVGGRGEALINVSGGEDGGTALVGAGTGLNTSRAINTYVDGQIDASARRGNGGRIVITSDGSTRAHGILDASGNQGGQLETSGVTLSVAGDLILGGTAGAGSWLASAADLTVVDRHGTEPRVGDGTSTTAAAGTSSVIDSHLIASTLLFGSDVHLRARDERTAAQTGNIVIASDIIARGSSSRSSTLTLEADGEVLISQGKSIQAGTGGMAVTVMGTGAVHLSQDSAIVTNGGAVNIMSTAGRVALTGSTIDTGSGDISIAAKTVEIGNGSTALPPETEHVGTYLRGQRVVIGGDAIRLTNGASIDTTAATADHRGIVMSGETLSMHGASLRSSGDIYLGAGAIELGNSRIASSKAGDAVLLSSSTLKARGSTIATANGRWLAYVNQVRDWNDTLGYDELGYQFLQVGNESTISPAVDNQSGVIVSAPMTVRVQVDANRTYDGTTQARFANALSDDLAPAFVLQRNDRTVEGQFADQHAGTGKTISHAGNEPVFGIVTSTGQTVYGARQTYVANITPKTITASNVTASGKVYDATRTAVVSGTLSGVIEGDRVSLDGAAGLFSDKHAGHNKTVLVDGGSLVGADARNYHFDDVTVLADIVPRAIDLTGLTASKSYDGTRTANLSGVLSGVLAGDRVGASYVSAEFNDKQAGVGKTVTVSGAQLFNNDAHNYVLGATGSVPGTITPRTIAATGLSALDKVYDGTRTATLSGALTGVIDGDIVGLGAATAQFSDKAVGTGKTVTISDPALTGADAANYRLGSPPTLVATITPRALSANGMSVLDKVYDGTRIATVAGGELAGKIAGDSVSLTNATGLFTDKHVGVNKVVTISGQGLAGADAGNYRLTDTTVRADITPRVLGTDGLRALDKLYDGSRAAALSGTLSGIVEGDSISLNGAGAQFSDRNAGVGKTVTLAGTPLAGADAGNYRLDNAQTLRADITPRQITATGLSAQDKVYDGTRTAIWSGTLAGTVDGDTVRLDAMAQFADKTAGAGKTVTMSDAALTGADAANYRLTALPALKATITPRSLGGTSLTVLDKVYDGTRAANVSAALSGIIAGDNVRLDGAMGLFDSKHTGTGKTVTLAGGVLAGADAGNYTISSDATGQASITPRPITASGLTALNKVYDGTRNATLTGTLSGVMEGDSVSLDNATGLFGDKHAGQAKTVTISGGALGGADADNYTLQGAPDVVADITPRPIAATGFGALDKVYDGTLAAELSGSLTDVLPGDTVAFDAAGQFDNRNVGGAKAVTITGTLSGPDAGNYSLSLPASVSAAITPATLFYEAAPGASIGGAMVDALGGTVSGFKGGDTLASATTGALQWQSPVTAASAPGTHPVYGSGLSAPNYVFVQAPGNASALILKPDTQASALPQRAQEGSTEAISSALAAVMPPVAPVAMDGAGRGAVIDTVGGTRVSASYITPDGASIDAVGSSKDTGAGLATVDTATVAGAVDEAAASAAGSSVTEQSVKASTRIFEPINIASTNQVDLEQLLVQRRDFKRKMFADAIYQLTIDPTLADVRPCANVADAGSGACRIMPDQLALLHAARTQASSSARSSKARIASVPQIERKIALLVGINAYGDKNIPQLKNAISDADAVGKVFAARLGYDVRVLHNPDKATIIRTLNALATEADSKDSVVIYFAGHGYSMDDHGAGYWLASDATVNGDLKGWISNSDVAQMLSGIRSKQVTLISDSCYSGAFAREGLGAVGQNVTVDDVLTKRSVVVLSSGGDEPVPDNGKAGHSIFAWNLMKVLNSVSNWTPGSSVFAVVQARVKKEFPQTPKYGSVTAAGHQSGGDYLFESRSN
jgi:filamentous hemagglutinin family protein